MNGFDKTIFVIMDNVVILDGNVYREHTDCNPYRMIEGLEFLYPKHGFELIYI